MLKQVFKESLKITWRNPILWLFGFFSTFLLFSTNEFFLIFFSQSLFLNLERSEEVLFLEGPSRSLNPFLLIIIFLIIIFLVSLSVFSEIFLILSIRKIKEKKRNYLGKESFKFIGRVLLLKIVLVLFFFIFWSVFNLFFGYFPDIFLFFFIFIFSLMGLVLFLIIRYSIFYLLIEKNSLSKSLKNGFLFFKKNLLKTFGLSFFLFLIIYIYNFIMLSLLSGGVFSYPLRIFNFIFSSIFGKYGFWFVAFLTAIFVLVLRVIITGLVNTYQICCWVLLFLKKQGKNMDNFNP